ncbi:MAG: CRR6 family NdhI maturation factor [Cyanobacteriota bacterium]
MPEPPEPIIPISAEQIRRLDTGPLQALRQRSTADLLALEDRLSLDLQWPRAEEDPRELSEIPELRLWSLRADARCPWLPLLLERRSGQLARHVAMLVPHQFQRNEGLRFDADALSLWISQRLFLLDDWAQERGVSLRGRLAQMAAVLGFELDDSFWDGLA